jgi:hypothetical protein
LFTKQPRRECEGTWSDWEGGSTGIPSPVLYALWYGLKEEIPLYIGQSIAFGPRLSVHLSQKSQWEEGISQKYASYLAHPDFKSEALLSVAERFLIAVMEPINNDPRKLKN